MSEPRASRAQAGTGRSADESLQPDVRVVLATARVRMDHPSRVALRDAIAAGVDWDAVVAFATAHGVGALAYRHLAAECRDAVPPAHLEQLRQVAQAQTHRGLLLAGTMLRVLDLLASDGIRAMPLKGPVLAQSLYGELGLRRFGDLDLLVPARDVERAYQVLLANGFAPHPAREREPTRLVLQSHGKHDLVVVDPGGLFLVELHFRLVSRGVGIALDCLVASRPLTKVAWGGRAMPALGPAEQLLYLCVMGALHDWDRLRRVVDVAEGMRQLPADAWSGLLADARTIGAEGLVLSAFELARRLLGAPCPPTVSPRIVADRRLRRLTEESARGFTALPATAPAGPRAMLARRFRQVQLLDRPTDRLRALALVVMAPGGADWAALRLPDRLGPVYAVLRPTRLAWRWAVRPVLERAGRRARTP